MAFQHQRYSAVGMAYKFLQDERFDFDRNIFGRLELFYNLRRGDINIPDRELNVYAAIEMHIQRNPSTGDYGNRLPDEIVIDEVRELLGKEARIRFLGKDIALGYDHLDEFYDPPLPERISVRVAKKEQLENPRAVRSNIEKRIRIIKDFDGYGRPIYRRPLTLEENIEFISTLQTKAFERISKHFANRKNPPVLPTRVY